MGCPLVRGKNLLAYASGLSYVQVDNLGMTILYHLHQCRPCTSRDSCAKVGKGGKVIVIPCLVCLYVEKILKLKRVDYLTYKWTTVV